jgi:type I restriction enzyme, S subunit
MKQGWKKQKLGELCEKISRGISPKYTEKNGVIVLNQKCIRDHQINFDLSRKHDETNKNMNFEKLIQYGDVLVNSTGEGTLGRVAQVRELPAQKVTVDSHISIVRPLKNKFFNDFFGWAMIYIESEIEKSGTGASGQTELARTILENNFSIAYPDSHDEQRRIVATLDHTFSIIAKAKTKAEQNLKNAKELFESYLHLMFENAKGKEQILADVCQITSLLIDPKNSKFQNLIHIGAGNIESRTGVLFDLKTAKEENLISAKFLFDESMVLYSKIRPYLMKVVNCSFKGLCSADIYPLVPLKNFISKDYLYYLLLTKAFTDYAIIGSQRAGMPKVNREHLFAYKLKLPSLLDQHSIVTNLNSLRNEVHKLEAIYEKKIINLEELKKSILNQAFAGELKTELQVQ